MANGPALPGGANGNSCWLKTGKDLEKLEKNSIIVIFGVGFGQRFHAKTSKVGIDTWLFSI